MFNFKALALTATIALGGIVGGITPADAKVGTCQAGWPGETLTRYGCNVDRRINANGHVVFDINDGTQTMTVVLWDDGSAEVIGNGHHLSAITEDLSGGRIRLIADHNDYNIVFPTR